MLFVYLSGTIGVAVAQKLEFRFPEGFRGTAIIVYESDCGQDQIIENDREILMIPKDGICFYKGNIATGYINHIYKIKTDSIYEVLPTLHRWNFNNEQTSNADSNTLGVFLEGMSTRTIHPNKESFSSIGLVLTSYDSLDQYYDFKYTKYLENRVDSLWQTCQNELGK
ncbi:MAG: hypothetical protein KI790_10615 [Cyclobacteriaceae bacterium]|nr:hypothetical protein [Cyclobacteriaceae bacterium HetDA_MAG_MS6]